MIHFCKRLLKVATAGFLVMIVPGNLQAQDYFQQRTDYLIKVKLDDQNHELHASEQLIYHNNSPDTLGFIIFHLWPNAYSSRHTALAKEQMKTGENGLFFSQKNEQGFIDSLDFSVAGIPARFVPDSINSDIGTLLLPQPLLPGDSIVITTPFHVKIPDASFSRLGHNGKQYLITQWYPKPAVYDKNGWHALTYQDQGEFYSEFGSFRVSITLPQNYVVGATGVLQDTSERKWLMNLAKETASYNSFPDSLPKIPSSKQFKTITFYQDSIHDFAFFADKRYHVLYDTISIPGTGKTIESWTFFTNRKASIWMKSNVYIKNTIQFYSQRCGPYPYSAVTVVDGLSAKGTEMEYPMITVIGTPANNFMLEDVIVHEVGHNWFYGIIGSNERDYAWMDEGINSAYEQWYTEFYNKKPGENDLGGFNGFVKAFIGANRLTFAEGELIKYRASAFNHHDQPISITSLDFTPQNYGHIVYAKTAVVFNYLRSYLGDSLFISCMREYYRQWAFKHPGPDDMQAIFESTSGQSLSWFFDGMIKSSETTDLKPKLSDKSGKFYVKEKGAVSPPAPYAVYSNAEKTSAGFISPDSAVVYGEGADAIQINHPFLPDVNPRNNTVKTSGILKSAPHVHLRMKPTLAETGADYPLTILPVPAWNNINGFMAGAVLSNISLIPKRTEFTITPLYDITHGTLNGCFKVDYYIYPGKGIFDAVTLSVSGKQFGLESDVTFPAFPELSYDLLSYSKIEPMITVDFKKQHPKSTLQHSVLVRSVFIKQDEIVYNYDGTDYIPEKTSAGLTFNEVNYLLSNSRPVDPFQVAATLEQGPNHLKSAITFNYTFSYAKFNKGLHTRTFFGGFIKNNEHERNYNFKMDGWSGSDDYKYDGLYFGRTDGDGFWSRQFLVRDGGFKAPTAVGQTADWLGAVNFTADLPLPLPISLFLDIGTYKGIKKVFPDIGNTVMYDGGICISLGEDFFGVYLPIFYSDDIRTAYDANDVSRSETIRFVLNINKLSLQHIRNTLLKWI
ncbi:MAG TPA: M1 family metallopeptidase [Bacteroidia bacterium]|nr:M1 family metallopeptidase [Bacteroidia bacterium]